MERKTLMRAAIVVALVAVCGTAGAFQWVGSKSIYNGMVIFGCEGWDASGTGSHILDRDNTGTGQEALRIDITDGSGALIYTLTYQNTLGTYGGGIGSDTYNQLPLGNPLTFTLTSLAGNGLPEQVDYVQQGRYACVPELSQLGIVLLASIIAIAGTLLVSRRHLG